MERCGDVMRMMGMNLDGMPGDVAPSLLHGGGFGCVPLVQRLTYNIRDTGSGSTITIPIVKYLGSPLVVTGALEVLSHAVTVVAGGSWFVEAKSAYRSPEEPSTDFVDATALVTVGGGAMPFAAGGYYLGTFSNPGSMLRINLGYNENGAASGAASITISINLITRPA